jgi:hypothetical protein
MQRFGTNRILKPWLQRKRGTDENSGYPSSESGARSRRLATGLTVVVLTLLRAAPGAAQELNINGLTIVTTAVKTSNGKVIGVDSFSGTVTYTDKFGNTSPLANTGLTVIFNGNQSSAIGITTDATGGFTVNVPPAYNQFKNKATFQYIYDSNVPESPAKSKPIIWVDDSYAWQGVKPLIKVDPTGYPGGSATGGPVMQDWFIDSSALLSGDPNPGADLVTASNFDVSYVQLGTSTTYDMMISGNDSYIVLSDGTEIDLPNGSFMGTIQIPAGCSASNAFSSLLCQSGSVDFSGIGIAGTWDYDPASNYTDLIGTSFSTFGSDPAISLLAAPEPSMFLILAAALLAIAVARARAKEETSGHNARHNQEVSRA